MRINPVSSVSYPQYQYVTARPTQANPKVQNQKKIDNYTGLSHGPVSKSAVATFSRSLQEASEALDGAGAGFKIIIREDRGMKK